MSDEPKGRKLPCMAIRDLQNPTSADIDVALRQMAQNVLSGLAASNQTPKIRRLILICDDQAIGESLQEWTASLEPGYTQTRVAKFNN